MLPTYWSKLAPSWRRVNMGLSASTTPYSVPLFAPPGHFYSPIVDPVEAQRHLTRMAARKGSALVSEVNIDRDLVVRTWRELVPLMQSHPFSDQPAGGLRYGFDNPHYAWGDGSVLHAMLRLHRPKRVIEIGSGFSSACTVDTVKLYLDGQCQMTFIEPFPELLHQVVGDEASQVRILAHGIQDAPLEIFEELEAGDFLFIDSTHVLRTGSDVCFELFEILPRLSRGVLVHFHDIFWPFDYPKKWSVEENRSWNEAYALRAFLMYNRAWNIVMFNDYLSNFELELIKATYPTFLRNSGGALWLQRV
jgi:predicted O-methyltransferase YrrM